MPVPGPRNQYRPLPGYRNPEGEAPDKFNLWLRPGPVKMAGRTPGLMVTTLRGCILAPGQIRRMYRQAINYTAAQAPYSWTQSGPAPGRPIIAPPAFHITRALRYLTRSVYMGAGIDNSRYEGLHSIVNQRDRMSANAVGRRVTIAGGSVRNRPTVRNRLTSFGSRVPTINQQIPGTDE